MDAINTVQDGGGSALLTTSDDISNNSKKQWRKEGVSERTLCMYTATGIYYTLAVKWQNHRTNEDIAITVKQKEIAGYVIRNRKLQLFGTRKSRKSLLKAKFHYTDVRDFPETSPKQAREKPLTYLGEVSEKSM